MGKGFRWKARHTVLSVLFVSWIVSFMDRMVMSVAIPYIAVDFHLTPLAMGVVMSAFFASYSVSQIPGGLLADIFGVRKIGTIALLWWSGFTAITGAVGNLTQMIIARLLFGLGEGIYPACVFKSVAVWFPPKERATANGIRFAASPLGSALSPLVVVGIMSVWGWRAAFFSLFVPGVVISLLVWIFVRDNPSESNRVSPEELVEIEGGGALAVRGPEMTGKLARVFKEPVVLKCFAVLFFFDIAYWGFATWLPTYLVRARGFTMTQMGLAASLPFFAGAIACVLGGWTSDKFYRRNRRRPIVAAQLLSAFLLYMTFTATSTTMLLISQTLAGFCLNFFFTAFWALPMNTVPREVMGVASGFINMAGQIAAFISPIVIGYLVGIAGGNYELSFVFLIALLLVSCASVFTLPSILEQSGA